MQNSKKIKYDNIELEEGPGTSPFIPQNSQNFIDHGNIMKTLAIGIRDNMPTLLIGESGTGKTSAIRYLANKTKNGLRRVNLNGGTTADELIGRLLINDKGTYWVDGILTEAMRNGDWIVLDEINAALPEVLFVLQSILDDDGYLVLNEKDDKEIVHKHQNFRLFATCNPPEYAGTKEMNKALLSRFAICISADFPPEKKEKEIIENHLGNAIASSPITEKMIELANTTRKAKEMGNADYAINTRDVINALKLSKFIDPIEALMLAFANKLEPADNKALRSIAKLHLPMTKKKGTTTLKKLNNPEELKIGNNYILTSDIQNIYYKITNNKKEFEELLKENLGDILEEVIPENGIKEDEFTINAFFYEEQDGASKVELDNAGIKIASAITFTAGPNNKKQAIIPHNKNLNNSEKIINEISEIE